MIGPVVLGALLIYLLISAALVYGVIRYAEGKGKNKKLYAWVAGLAMLLIPFWDWIPTMAAHQFYCSREAGFWVYKTVDQWKIENPEILETLVSNKGRNSNMVGDRYNSTITNNLNQRFIFLSKHNGPFFPNRWRREQEIIDRKNGEVLARHVDFYTSQERPQAGWSGWKFWLSSERCGNYAHMDNGSISDIKNRLEGK